MLRGIITALITPFKNQKLDEEGFIQLVDRQVNSSIDGLLVLGTTGESPTLSREEKKRLIHLTLETSNGVKPVIVGTGTNCTQKTIDATLEAKDLGAQAALIIAPYYNRPTQEGLYRHYTEIANACDFPIIVYNHPGRTGVHMQSATLLKIAEHPQIIGIKESCNDLSHMQTLIENRKPGFKVFTSNDEMAYVTYALGGDGVISVASNLVPEKMCAVSDLATHRKLRPLFEALTSESNPIPIKAAMALAGLPAGDPRLPLTPLCPEKEKNLEEVMKKLNLKVQKVYP